MGKAAESATETRFRDSKWDRDTGARRRVETTSRRSRPLHSQCFVAEVGRFWWVELMQLAVKDVETVEAHLRLYDRRVPYTRAVREYSRAIARYARRIVVQLLLLCTATTSSHVSRSTAVPTQLSRTDCGHERSTTRRGVRLTLVRPCRGRRRCRSPSS